VDDEMIPEPRWGWLAVTALAGLFTVVSLVGGFVTLSITVRDGVGSPVSVLVSAAATTLFWGWMTGGAWRRAREPEPDPMEPAPVARRAAFAVANVILAVLVTAFVAVGQWADITEARERARTEVVRTRVEAAARDADLDANDVETLHDAWLTWLGKRSDGASAGADPTRAVFPDVGAEVIDFATSDGQAAILFRPTDGSPCVALDIDELGIISSRRVSRC